MSRVAGTSRAWSAVLVFAAGSIAVASALLSYLVSPVAVIGLFIGAIGLWAIASFKIGAILLLMLSLPLGRLTLTELGPVPVSPVTALAGALVLIWLCRLLIGQEKLEASWMQLPLAVFLLCGVLSFYWAADTVIAAKIAFIFVMGAAVYMVVSHTVRSAEEVRAIIWTIAIATGLIGSYAVAAEVGIIGGVSEIQIYDSGESYSRVEGLFTHPNQLGGFLALTIPLLTALTVSERSSWMRALGYLLIAVSVAGLALTYSRGAWVGTGLGLLILLPVLRRGAWLVPGVALVGAVASSSAILERLQSIASFNSDSAVTGRFEFWSVALKLVAENPLSGIGLGNWYTVYGTLPIQNLPRLPYSLEVPAQAHNLFLNLAVEIGLVGAGAFILMLGFAFYGAVKIISASTGRTQIWTTGICAGLAAMVAQNLIDVTIYQGFMVLVLFTYLGLLETMRRFEKSEAI